MTILQNQQEENKNQLFDIKKATRFYGRTPVLSVESIQIFQGEVFGILGRSGSGKSTLLNILSTLDYPTSQGSHELDIICYISKNQTIFYPIQEESTRINLRLNHFGIVFQSTALFSYLKAIENVMIQSILQKKQNTMHEEARKWLNVLNLGDLQDRLGANMSGGQAQRVTLARAFFGEPSVIIADEPTSNLDTKTVQLVFRKFNDYVVEKQERTVIMATHNVHEAVEHCNRILVLRDGKKVEDRTMPEKNGAFDIISLRKSQPTSEIVEKLYQLL